MAYGRKLRCHGSFSAVCLGPKDDVGTNAKKNRRADEDPLHPGRSLNDRSSLRLETISQIRHATKSAAQRSVLNSPAGLAPVRGSASPSIVALPGFWRLGICRPIAVGGISRIHQVIRGLRDVVLALRFALVIRVRTMVRLVRRFLGHGKILLQVNTRLTGLFQRRWLDWRLRGDPPSPMAPPNAVNINMVFKWRERIQTERDPPAIKSWPAGRNWPLNPVADPALAATFAVA